MKKIILFILCIASVSCITQKSLRTNRTKAIYQIGTVQIKNVDQNQLEVELQKRGEKMFYMGSPNNPTIYYTSPDYEILAERLNINIAFSCPLSQRYENIRSLTVYSGSTILSSDSISIGQNWVYAFEFRHRGKDSDKILFSIESNNTQILIRTDKDHKATAVGLMDAFTKELMNVKLNLKPYKK